MSLMVQSKVGLCPMCGKEGIIRAVELLPIAGTLMRIRHPDGKEHRWAEYDSVYDIGYQPPRSKPIRIHCPKCGEMGRIGYYHPRKRRPEKVSYFVVHGRIEGLWGRDKKMRKRKRCYISKSEQRDIILRKLGRYIRH